MIFQRYVGGDKKVIKEKRLLKIATHLNPQDVPESERKDPNQIKDCVTNTDAYLRDNCEISFEGDYSNQKNCKSMTVRTSAKKDFAITSKDKFIVKASSEGTQKGDVMVNGYGKARNQNVLKNLTIYL